MSVSMQRKEAISHLVNTVRYDKRTTNLDPKEEMFFMHYLQNDPLVGDYIRSQMQMNPTFRKEVLNQPVCPRCEGFCFFNKGGAQCPKCGQWTPENQTHRVKEHMRGGYHR